MPSYQLIARRGPRAGEKFPLTTQTIIIGRDSTADITLNDPEVSRNHCRLISDDNYYIQDLGSTNGIEFEGKRVDNHRVEEGAVYFLCDHKVRCTYSQPS